MDREKQNRVVDIGHEATAKNAAVEPSVELQIDELVLHGFTPCDRYAIADAIQRELSHLLAAPDGRALRRVGSHRERLDGGMFTVVPGSHGRVVGAQVARALYGTLVPSGKDLNREGARQAGKGSRPR